MGVRVQPGSAAGPEAHHARHHDGVYTIEAPAPHVFVFRHSAGWIIGRADVDLTDQPSIESQNRDLGVDIDGDTCRPQWAGEPCDYSVAIEHLLARSGLPRYTPSRK